MTAHPHPQNPTAPAAPTPLLGPPSPGLPSPLNASPDDDRTQESFITAYGVRVSRGALHGPRVSLNAPACPESGPLHQAERLQILYRALSHGLNVPHLHGPADRDGPALVLRRAGETLSLDGRQLEAEQPDGTDLPASEIDPETRAFYMGTLLAYRATITPAMGHGAALIGECEPDRQALTDFITRLCSALSDADFAQLRRTLRNSQLHAHAHSATPGRVSGGWREELDGLFPHAQTLRGMSGDAQDATPEFVRALEEELQAQPCTGKRGPDVLGLWLATHIHTSQAVHLFASRADEPGARHVLVQTREHPTEALRGAVARLSTRPGETVTVIVADPRQLNPAAWRALSMPMLAPAGDTGAPFAHVTAQLSCSLLDAELRAFAPTHLTRLSSAGAPRASVRLEDARALTRLQWHEDDPALERYLVRADDTLYAFTRETD